MSQVARAALIAIVVTFPSPLWANDAPTGKLLMDFESSNYSQIWEVLGPALMSREEGPGYAGGAMLPPAGFALRVDTRGVGGVENRTDKPLTDWSHVGELTFWLCREPEQARRRPRGEVDILFAEADGKTGFTYRVAYDHTGWKQFRVPLVKCQPADNTKPDWQRIVQLGFSFRDDGRFWIDTIAIVSGDARPKPPSPIEQLAALAFPGKPVDQLKVVQSKTAWLLSDAAGLDAAALAEHLAKIAETVRSDWRPLAEPDRPPALLVFENRDASQTFRARRDAALAKAAKPAATDDAWHGLGISWWDASFGSLRGAYTHEFVHAMVARCTGLDDAGEWFHAGLASYYQLKFHPQQNFAQIVRDGLANESRHLPLERLCDGTRLEIGRYWQAATVIEMLLSVEKYRQGLPKFVAALAEQRGQRNLGPLLGPVWGVDWQQFTTDWRGFCEQRYVAQGNAAQ